MGQIQADNTVNLDYVDTLVWALAWHHQHCLVLGPRANLNRIAPPQPWQAPAWADSCDHLVLIDAKTGRYLFMYDGPGST